MRSCNVTQGILKGSLRKSERKAEMRKFIPFIIILLAITACTAPHVRPPAPTATSTPPVNMPNPASVYCVQHGNKLEIHTAADGCQSGVCVFPDGSTCDEWSYFRGECGFESQVSPTPATAVEAPQKQAAVNPEETPRAVTCRQAPQRR